MKSKQIFLIFNHHFTKAQEFEAKTTLGIHQIVCLPENLRSLWSQIPPGLERIRDYLLPLAEWLETRTNSGDYILIQGDFGACYLMVRFAFDRGLIPIYSTTRREAVEETTEDGSIRMVHHFKHHSFRRYGV